MPATSTPTDPASDPVQPQGTAEDATTLPPTIDQVNALWADLHAGRIAMPDFLTRLAEMQAAFLGS